MSIIDCSALIEPHFHWPSYPFVSQDPERGDEFQEFGLKWRGPGFSHVTAPGWRIEGGRRLDEFPLHDFASVARIIDLSSCDRISALTLASVLDTALPSPFRILVLRTGHSGRVSNRHIAYWSTVPIFDVDCAAVLHNAGVHHVVLDIPCDELIPRRPLDDGYVSNPNKYFRQALHDRDILVTENAENLAAIEQDTVFFCALPLSLPRAALSPVRPLAHTSWPSDNPQLFDVSTPLFNHWRWFIDVNDGKSLIAGDNANEIHFTIRGHGFTHCDAPRHMRRDGLTIQQLPNQGLDVFHGDASIIDMSDIALPFPVSVDLLEERAQHIREGDMVVLRTDLTNRTGYESRRWHTLAPNLPVDAAEWLLNKKPKALVLDFPQDHVAREMPDRHVSVNEFKTHLAVFARNVPFVEDLKDIGMISSNRSYLMAVPLKTTCIDGAMMRVLFVQW